MLEDDCRYMMVRYLRSLYLWKLRIYGLLEGVKLSHFSANQKDGAQCCYNLTTKKLCVELQPLRVGHGGTASADAPHHCNRRGASPYTHCTSGILLSKVETNKVLGHDHFLFSFSFSFLSSCGCFHLAVSLWLPWSAYWHVIFLGRSRETEKSSETIAQRIRSSYIRIDPPVSSCMFRRRQGALRFISCRAYHHFPRQLAFEQLLLFAHLPLAHPPTTSYRSIVL